MVMQILGLLKNTSFIRLKAFNFSVYLNAVTFDLNFWFGYRVIFGFFYYILNQKGFPINS